MGWWIIGYDRYFRITKEEFDAYPADHTFIEQMVEAIVENRSSSGAYFDRFVFSEKPEENRTEESLEILKSRLPPKFAEFPDIDPLNPQNSGRVLASLPDYQYPKLMYYFVASGSHIIIASCIFSRLKPDEPEEWHIDQVVLPPRAIPWFVDTIESEVLKNPSEGGPSTDEFKWVVETIDGEKLKVSRSQILSDKPIEGASPVYELKIPREIDGLFSEVSYYYIFAYQLSTLSRLNKRGFALEFTFSDEFLFQHGMFDAFKRVAEMVRKGEV
jgi:hypothetical protein